jgi:hypothetical protein
MGVQMSATRSYMRSVFPEAGLVLQMLRSFVAKRFESALSPKHNFFQEHQDALSVVHMADLTADLQRVLG